MLTSIYDDEFEDQEEWKFERDYVYSLIRHDRSDPRLSYEELLTWPEWKTFRELVLRRDKFSCLGPLLHVFPRGCSGYLVVHHLDYKDGCRPWDYPLSWCITLCRKHHRLAHSFNHPQPIFTGSRAVIIWSKLLRQEVL